LDCTPPPQLVAEANLNLAPRSHSPSAKARFTNSSPLKPSSTNKTSAHPPRFATSQTRRPSRPPPQAGLRPQPRPRQPSRRRRSRPCSPRRRRSPSSSGARPWPSRAGAISRLWSSRRGPAGKECPQVEWLLKSSSILSQVKLSRRRRQVFFCQQLHLSLPCPDHLSAIDAESVRQKRGAIQRGLVYVRQPHRPPLPPLPLPLPSPPSRPRLCRPPRHPPARHLAG
jgi:hypothetical protein